MSSCAYDHTYPVAGKPIPVSPEVKVQIGHMPMSSHPHSHKGTQRTQSQVSRNMSLYKGPCSGSLRDIKVEVSVTITDRSKLYAFMFNHVFYKEDQARLLSFSTKSSVLFPLGFHSSSVPLLHPQVLQSPFWFPGCSTLHTSFLT